MLIVIQHWPFTSLIKFIAEPSQPRNLTPVTYTSTGSVLLSWAPPTTGSDCVIGYIIMSSLSNSTTFIPNTLNHTLSAEGGVVTSCSYTASVAAKDTAGRMGEWSEEVEFFLVG